MDLFTIGWVGGSGRGQNPQQTKNMPLKSILDHLNQALISNPSNFNLKDLEDKYKFLLFYLKEDLDLDDLCIFLINCTKYHP